jgi:hypothetical protein
MRDWIIRRMEEASHYHNLHPAQFTEFWGPSAWRMLHSITFTMDPDASEEQRKHYETFFKTIGHILPCPSCRQHYNLYVEEHPPDASSPKALAKWLYLLHDSVNARIHKTARPSFEEVEQYYTSGDVPAHLKDLDRKAMVRGLGLPWMEPASSSQSFGSSSSVDWLLLLLVVLFLCILFLYVSRKRQ